MLFRIFANEEESFGFEGVPNYNSEISLLSRLSGFNSQGNIFRGSGKFVIILNCCAKSMISPHICLKLVQHSLPPSPHQPSRESSAHAKRLKTFSGDGNKH